MKTALFAVMMTAIIMPSTTNAIAIANELTLRVEEDTDDIVGGDNRANEE